MGLHCPVRLECLLVAILMTLTLEPIKSLCTISTLGWSSCVMVSLSHLHRLCHSIYWRVLEYDTHWMGSLLHFGRRFSGKAFALFALFREMGFPPWTLLVFQTVSLRLEIEPFWMFVAHSLTPLNCCW